MAVVRTATLDSTTDNVPRETTSAELLGKTMTEWHTKLVSVKLNENNEHVYLYEDGTVEVKRLWRWPLLISVVQFGGTVRKTYANGQVRWQYADGTEEWTTGEERPSRL